MGETVSPPNPKSGPFHAVGSAMNGWYIVGGNGIRFGRQYKKNGEPYSRLSYVVAVCATLNGVAKVAAGHQRACMCCGKSFESEGPHNRLCGPCRRRGNDGLPAGFSFAAANGSRHG